MSLSKINDEFIDAALLKQLFNADFKDDDVQHMSSTIEKKGNDFDLFPLTDIQRGYFMGRNPNMVLGGSSCQFYYEVDCEQLDIERYQWAWQQVIERHLMLRSIVLNASEQQVLKSVPEFILPIHDLRQQDDHHIFINEVRNRITKDIRPHDQWPLFDVEISLLSDGHTRIHLGFDLLIADQYSLLTVMKEVATLYENPTHILPVLEYSFREYVIDSKEALRSDYERAKSYWLSRLAQIPATPNLPLLMPLHAIEKPYYERISQQLDKATWAKVKDIAIDLGVTPSCILLALFGEALCYAVEAKEGEAVVNKFSLNMTLFNRQALHAHINNVVGDFTSNLLFAMNLEQKITRKEFFMKVQADLWRDIEHSVYSGIEVMSEIAKHEGHLDSPVMPVVFTCTLSQADTELFSNASTQLGKPIFQAAQTPQAILDNQLIEWEGQLQINWDITSNALDLTLATKLLDHYVDLIEKTANEHHFIEQNIAEKADPTVGMLAPSLSSSSLLSPSDTIQPSHYRRLSDLWLNVLPRCLNQPAIKSIHTTTTHQQLAMKVSGISWQLSKMGVKAGDTVCIAIDKSVEQIATCLAVSIIGAVYVPIDNNQPSGRIQKIIGNLQPNVIIHQGDNVEKSFIGTFSLLNISDVHSRDMNELFQYEKATEDALAYIIYTSGTTGMPKGVCVNHFASLNTCLDVNQRFNVKSDDCILGLSALHFDLSVYDIFGVLGKGASIALPDPEEIQNPQHWATLCEICDVSIWNSVPALWSLFVHYLSLHPEKIKPTMYTVMLSGDWIPLNLVPSTRDIFPDVNLYSLGGATEAAIWSIYYSINELDPQWKSIPYGKALGGQQVFVLNNDLQIVLPGQIGDIYIAGLGLAKGYYLDEEKTALSFFKHPRTGLSLYRTGDLGCYYADGNIEFKGRLDSQLKINGYRVELGEVSRAILDHSSVEDAVVLPIDRAALPAGENNKNQTQLTAFIKVDKKTLTSSLLSQYEEVSYTKEWDLLGLLTIFLSDLLPHYMLPTQWYVLTDWPLTDNGKVNVELLKQLANVSSSQIKLSPHTVNNSTEKKQHNISSLKTHKKWVSEQVLQLVAKVLNIEKVTLDDNLVALGASSVELISLASRIEKLTSKRPPLPELARSVQLSDLVNLVVKLMPEQTIKNKVAALENYVSPLFSQEAEFRDYLQKTPTITDLDSRKLFKSKPHNMMINKGDNVALIPVKQRKHTRKSWRTFSSEPSLITQISQLLGPLREYYLEGKKTLHYASAGGLYPVEVYLIHDGKKIKDLPAGGYFYNSESHELTPCNDAYRDPSASTINFSALSGRNSEWLKEAHFLLCMVMRMDQIVPLYEAASLSFCLLECGAISQLLEQEASDAGLGLCQVGDMSLDRLGLQLRLSDDRLCLHTLAGGALEQTLLNKWKQLPINYSQTMTEGEL